MGLVAQINAFRAVNQINPVHVVGEIGEADLGLVVARAIPMVRMNRLIEPFSCRAKTMLDCRTAPPICRPLARAVRRGIGLPRRFAGGRLGMGRQLSSRLLWRSFLTRPAWLRSRRRDRDDPKGSSPSGLQPRTLVFGRPLGWPGP